MELLLGLIFSTLTSLNNLSNLSPSPEIEESLIYLKERSPDYEIIFSHPDDSYLVEYYAQRQVFTHYHDSDFKQKQNITNLIFQSTYIQDTFPILEQYNISYIYLSPQTRVNLPTDRGLIFLFQNERFKRTRSRNNTEIWEFD
jgi:hypothetical protein